MNLNKESENKLNVLKEIESLAQKVQTTQERFIQINSILSNEFQEIKKRLKILTDVQKQKQVESNVPKKGCSQSEFNDLLDDNISLIFKKEEDVWLFEPFLPLTKIPRFVPISERPARNRSKATRFVSFINFKGGVGKTTLTANLAAAFATGNYYTNSRYERGSNLRVLIVDLDFQGTLSDRCVENRPLINAIEEGRTSAALLTLPRQSKFDLKDLVLDIIRLDGASIISTDDDLDVKDNEHFVRLAFKRRDIRYCYRLWFHQQQVFDTYDLVIFDCPPRKTASSICALAASDFVFVPSAPESYDVSAVTRTVNWLLRLRYNLKLPLKIGGIIFNRTMYQTKFSPSEQTFAGNLARSLLTDVSGINPEIKGSYVKENGTPTIFKSYVPKRQGTNSINGERGDVLPGSLSKSRDFPFFTEVATEMYERIYQ